MDKKPFDVKTLILVAIVGILFFGWQKYLETKYPDYYKQKTQTTEQNKEVSNSELKTHSDAKSVATEKETAEVVVDKNILKKSITSKTIQIQTNIWKGLVSSQGMGFEQIQVLTHLDHDGLPIFISNQHPLFQIIDLHSKLPIEFDLKTNSDGSIEGLGYFEDGTSIRRVFEVNTQSGFMSVSTEIFDLKPGFKGFGLLSNEVKKENKSSSFLMPSLDHQEVVVRNVNGVEHFKFEDDLNQTLPGVDIFAISSQYFTASLIDKANLLGEINVSTDSNKVTKALISYLVPPSGSSLVWNSKIYFGPKSFELLSQTDEALTQVINFGFF